ncbi:MAG: helix-turn-helix domain-containing protein [Bdellovibrionota bacterium]
MGTKNDTAEQGFGTRLSELRKAAGYTQVELAEALGMSQRMIAYYESIEDNPLAKILRLLAQTLRVSTDELLGVSPPRSKSRRKSVRKSRGKGSARAR